MRHEGLSLSDSRERPQDLGPASLKFLLETEGDQVLVFHNKDATALQELGVRQGCWVHSAVEERFSAT